MLCFHNNLVQTCVQCCLFTVPVAVLPFISAPSHVASFCLGILICVQPVVDTAVQYRTLRKVTTQLQRVW